MTKIATLCYLTKGDHILLIRKKTGMGAGFWNGVGGKLRKGEQPHRAAVRETIEEIGIRPENPVYLGVNEFYFGKKAEPEWVVHVFAADKWRGQEKESREAKPQWFHREEIPFENMWPDDTVWMPLMLAGTKFRGKFYYDEKAEKLIDHKLEEAE